MNRNIYGIIAIFVAVIYLLYTPLQSRFVTHIGEPDFRFGLLEICISLTNKLHIIGFGVLTILLLLHFASISSKYLKIFSVVLSFGLIIEISQIFFTEGHFRLRDLVPDSVGILLSFLLYKLLLQNNIDKNDKKTMLMTIFIVLIQIIFAMVSYYIFKEISVMIGGENLRRFL